jgi:hypothetical protein
MFVPVIDGNTRKPLMPTTPSRARRMIKSKEATPFWKNGIFCIRLNKQSSGWVTQAICVGIDPGSKKEGYSVVSFKHHFLNIQCDAVTHVKDRIKRRHHLRNGRRFRKTPCRKNKLNKNNKIWDIPPSTKARWQLKLRVLGILDKLYPISNVVVEDIKASYKKNRKKWNESFSPLQIGKNWFYGRIQNIYELDIISGYETYKLRTETQLKKSTKKLSDNFYSHCVDSWIIAAFILERGLVPTNKNVIYWIPLNFYRRQLHTTQPTKGGSRRKYGGTISIGIKRGSLVKHLKYGICYVGGSMKDKLTLHDLHSNKRLSRVTKITDCKIIGYNCWRYY